MRALTAIASMRNTESRTTSSSATAKDAVGGSSRNVMQTPLTALATRAGNKPPIAPTRTICPKNNRKGASPG